MSNTKFVIVRRDGSGYLRSGYNRSFPLIPNNFVSSSDRKFDAKVMQFDSFSDASTEVQIMGTPRGTFEITAMPE